MNQTIATIAALTLLLAATASSNAQSTPSATYGKVLPHPILDTNGSQVSPPASEMTTALNTSEGRRNTWLSKGSNTPLFADPACTSQIGVSSFLAQYYEVWRDNDVVLLAESDNPEADDSVPGSGHATRIAGYAKQDGFMRSKSGEPAYKCLKTESNVDKKALVVHKWQDNMASDRTTLYDAPSVDGQQLGEVNLYELFFVYAETPEDSDGQSFFLVGRTPFFYNEGGENPGEMIRGWLSSHRVFPWNHRECVEFNKDAEAMAWRTGNNEPIRVFATSDEAFAGTDPLLEEDLNQGNPMLYNEPRFPVMKSDEGQHSEVIKAGIIGDSYSGDRTISRGLEASLQTKIEEWQALARDLDVLIVIDATGSMGEFYQSINHYIDGIQQALGDANDTMYAVSYYRDYTEDEDASSWSTYYRDFLPPEEFSHLFDASKPEYIQSSGGYNNPCMFAGITEGVESVSWREGAWHAVILIGDMGNSAPSSGIFQEGGATQIDPAEFYLQDDARGYTLEKTAATLNTYGCTLTPIQAMPHARGQHPQIDMFYLQGEQLIKRTKTPLLSVQDATGFDLSGSLDYLVQSSDDAREKLINVYQHVKEGKELDEAMRDVLEASGINSSGDTAVAFDGDVGVLIKQKVLDMAAANGVDVDLLLSKRIQNFSYGYTEIQFPGSPYKNFKTRIFMQVGEVESLLAALRLLERQPMTADNVDKVWRGIVNALIGEHEDAFTFDEDLPLAAYFTKSLGLPAQSPYLKKSIRELKTLEPQEMSDWHADIAEKVQLLSNWITDKSADGTRKERHVFPKNSVDYVYVPIEFFP